MIEQHESYRRLRARARWLPAWLLRRRERRIVTRVPQPSEEELTELAAIRRELRARGLDNTDRWP